MKKHTLLFAASILCSFQLLAQNVGINTTTPDPSAALEIKDPSRGLLIPRVVLKSKNDNTVIANPATGLLVYSYTAAPTMYAGPGFYYNEGTPQSPSWRSTADMRFPYVAAAAEDMMVDFQNYGGPTSTTLKLSTIQGYALQTQGKIKIGVPNQSPGLGKVLTSDASGNATWEGGVAFRASGIAGGGKIASGAAGETKIPFATQEYDLAANFDENNANPTRSEFAVPVKGVYHFDAAICWDYDLNNLTQFTVLTLILKKGQVESELGHIICQQGMSSLALSTDVLLNPGDQVYVKVRHTASQEYITLKSPSFFSGRLMIKQ